MDRALPRLVVNFKNYSQASGQAGIDLMRIISEKNDGLGLEVGLCVNVLDMKDALREAKGVSVYAQHVDPIGYGSYTGKVNPEYLVEMGVAGSLINHSEDRVGLYTIVKEIESFREMGIISIVCVESLEEARVVADMKPDIIAYEPPELIGGDVSVATASPDLIEKIVREIECPVMVGAGIKTAEDVRVCLELGAYGVLVASGIVKSEEPGKVVSDFLEVIQKNV